MMLPRSPQHPHGWASPSRHPHLLHAAPRDPNSHPSLTAPTSCTRTHRAPNSYAQHPVLTRSTRFLHAQHPSPAPTPCAPAPRAPTSLQPHGGCAPPASLPPPPRSGARCSPGGPAAAGCWTRPSRRRFPLRPLRPVRPARCARGAAQRPRRVTGRASAPSPGLARCGAGTAWHRAGTLCPVRGA